MSRKVNITAYIELADLEKLEDLSRETGKSVSSLIREAIKKFLEEK